MPSLKKSADRVKAHCQWILDDGHYSADLCPPNLEFYCSCLSSSDFITRLNTEILVSCESLRCFGGQLELLQSPKLDSRNRVQCAFQNLIALDLACFSSNVLCILADTDHLQLRYSRLGGPALASSGYQSTVDANVRAKEVLNKILTNLKTLEILIAMDTPRLGASTIKLLTQMKLNPKLAAFAQSSFLHEEDREEQWTVDILYEFGKMLLTNDPDLDLSQFCLALKDKKEYQGIIDRNVGFTLIDVQDVYESAWHDFTLNNLAIKRRLGLMF